MLAGSLEVELMADVARLRKDMGEALSVVQRTARGIEDAAGHMRSALAGIGGGISGAAFATWIKGAIDFQDELNDLNKTTDITIGKLAGISLMSKQTGSDLTGMAQSINKLTLEMGKAPEKFAKIGVTAKEPLEAFKQFSEIFRSIEDPQLRAAVAAEALGKGWAGAAPALAEGADAIDTMVKRGEELAGVTELDAQMADQFNDSMSELQTAVMGSATILARDMLPLLTELVKSLTDVTQEANEADGGFNIITETMRALIVIGGNVAFVIHGIATEIGGMAAQSAAFLSGDFRMAAQIGKDMTADAERRRTAFDAWEQRMLGAGRAAGQLGDATDALSRRMDANARSANRLSADVLRGFLDGGAAAKKATEEAEKAKKAGAELAAGLLAQESGLAGDFAKKWESLSTAYRGGAISLEVLVAAQAQLLQQQPAMVKAQKDALDIALARQKARNDEDQQIRDFQAAEKAAQRQAEKNGQAQLEAIQFETAALRMTNVEREQAIALRALEREGMDKSSDAYKQLAEDIKKAVGDREAQREHLKFWDSIDATAHDVFTNVLEGGQDLWTKLRDTGRAIFFDWLYQMTLKRWILNIGMSSTGQGISAAASPSAGGFTQLLGMAGSLGTFGGGLSAGFGGLAGSIGSLLGLSGTGATLGGSLGAGVTALGAGNIAGGLGTLAGALGPIAMVAVPLIMSMLKSGGPKADGRFGAGLLSGIGTSDNSLLGAVQPGVESLNAQYAALAKQLGSTAAIEFGLAISRDPKGTANTMLEIGATKNGSQLFSNLNRGVGRSDDDLQQALAVATTDALIGALKAADIQGPWAEILGQIAEDASQEVKNGVLARIQKAMGERTAIEARIFDLTATDLEKLAKARADERAQIDSTNQALLDQLYLLEDQRKAEERMAEAQAERTSALLEAYNREQDALRDTIERHEGYVAALRRFQKQLAMGPQALLSPEAQYQANKAEFERIAALAQGGDEGALQEFQAAGEAFLAASQQYFASSGMYFVDLAAVQGATEATALRMQATVDVERLQLNVQQQQLTQLGILNTNLVSFNQALANYIAGQQAASTTPATNTAAAVAQQAADWGIDPSRIQSNDYGSWIGPMTPTLPAFTPEQSAAFWGFSLDGSHAGGLSYVPFDGYRAELHRGERVMTAADNSAMSDYLSQLCDQVARLNATFASYAGRDLEQGAAIEANTSTAARNAHLAASKPQPAETMR